MKRQIRMGVFETNSSSTHSLALFNKEEFEKFKNNKALLKYDLKTILTEEQCNALKTDEYEKFIQQNDLEDDMSALAEFTEDYYSYDSMDEYEILEKEVPGTDYVAVSFFSYEG